MIALVALPIVLIRLMGSGDDEADGADTSDKPKQH